MLHIFFFKSSCNKDNVSNITVLTTNVMKAYHLATKQFIKHGYKGYPVRVAI